MKANTEKNAAHDSNHMNQNSFRSYRFPSWLCPDLISLKMILEIERDLGPKGMPRKDEGIIGGPCEGLCRGLPTVVPGTMSTSSVCHHRQKFLSENFSLQSL